MTDFPPTYPEPPVFDDGTGGKDIPAYPGLGFMLNDVPETAGSRDIGTVALNALHYFEIPTDVRLLVRLFPHGDAGGGCSHTASYLNPQHVNQLIASGEQPADSGLFPPDRHHIHLPVDIIGVMAAETLGWAEAFAACREFVHLWQTVNGRLFLDEGGVKWTAEPGAGTKTYSRADLEEILSDRGPAYDALPWIQEANLLGLTLAVAHRQIEHPEFSKSQAAALAKMRDYYMEPQRFGCLNVQID